MTNRLSKITMIAVSLLLLAACDEETYTPPAPTLTSLPTLTPTSLIGVPVDTAVARPQMVNATVTPNPTAAPATSLPALALPDASGISVACADNSLRVPLSGPAGGSIGAASRIVSHGSWLYLLIDGGLYRMDRLALEAGQPGQLEIIMLPDDYIAGRPIQELVDIDVDPVLGRIYTLDKAGHVFSFQEDGGAKTIAYQAVSDLNEPVNEPSYEFVALAVDEQGRPIILDSSKGVLWTPASMGTLLPLNRGSSLTASVDVTSAGGQFYTLQRNGTLRVLDGGEGSKPWRDADGRRLGIALRTSDHLGTPLVYTVDGVRREVIGMLPGGSIVTRYVVSFPDIGLLRDAVFADGRLIALADNQLIIYPGPASQATSASCPPPRLDAFMQPQLYGVDVLGLLAGMTSPIDGARLPSYSHLYPGAARLYRMGVHRGVDFFGYRRGWPVAIIGDGVVASATLDYQDVSTSEFERMVSEASMLGKTPPEYLERLEGKQVVIDHGNGVFSFYAHLDEIAVGIVPGATVHAGQLVGTVGVSGTLAESQPGTVGSHLHFEIRIGDRYLGQGITIRETMWWLGEIFGNLAPALGPVPTP